MLPGELLPEKPPDACRGVAGVVGVVGILGVLGVDCGLGGLGLLGIGTPEMWLGGGLGGLGTPGEGTLGGQDDPGDCEGGFCTAGATGETCGTELMPAGPEVSSLTDVIPSGSVTCPVLESLQSAKLRDEVVSL